MARAFGTGFFERRAEALERPAAAERACTKMIGVVIQLSNADSRAQYWPRHTGNAE